MTNTAWLDEIEAGVLRAEKDTVELDDVLQRALLERLGLDLAIGRLRSTWSRRPWRSIRCCSTRRSPTSWEALWPLPDAAYTLRITAHDFNAAAVRLTVEDGSGVPKEALDLLFDRFYRAHRRGLHAARDGTGIGLTVVRGLVEAMGGSVVARESELGGLAIDMDLPPGNGASRPVGLADNVTTDRTGAAGPGGPGPTILVVEDDTKCTAALVRELRVGVGTGSRRPLMDDRPSSAGRTAGGIILLDLGLPDIDGVPRSSAASAARPRRQSSSWPLRRA